MKNYLMKPYLMSPLMIFIAGLILGSVIVLSFSLNTSIHKSTQPDTLIDAILVSQTDLPLRHYAILDVGGQRIKVDGIYGDDFYRFPGGSVEKIKVPRSALLNAGWIEK